MKRRLFAVAMLGWTVQAYAGGVLELVPGQPGPYLPGQSVSVEVWLHNEEAFDIDLRLVALDIQGLRSRLFAGGAFLTSGGVTVNHVAKLSGDSWVPLDDGLDGPVYALQACPLNGGTTLYAGGESPNPNQQYDWDATVHRMEYGGGRWSEIGRGADYRMLSFLCASDGSDQWMYAGGYFWNFGGTDSRHILKWDGSEWSAMPGLNGSVRDMLTFDDGTGLALHVAGNFPNAMPPNSNVLLYNVAKLNGTAWAPLYTGLMFGGTEWAVNALAVFDDGLGPTLYAGGDFWYSYISETDSLLPVFNIARWDGAHWFSLGGLTHSDHRPFVRDMVVFEDSSGPALFVGGRFDNAGGVPDLICSDITHVACNQQLYPYFDDGIPVNNIARWDGNSWSDVGGGVTGEADAAVYALAVLDDGSGPALYAAGRFASAGGASVSNIARWDGTNWTAVGNGFDDKVHALAVHEASGDPNLIIEGMFEFDFSTLADGGAQYALFPELPGPILLYVGDLPVPGSILHIPAGESLRLGAMIVTTPSAPATYFVEVANPHGTYGGALLAFGFGGPGDPEIVWASETGELTGEPIAIVVHPNPQANDVCENAVPGSVFELTVPAAGQTLTEVLDNTWATTGTEDPPFSCRHGSAGPGVGSLWYLINLAGSNSLAARAIGSVGGPLIALYNSPTGMCGDLVEVGCSADCVGNADLWVTGLNTNGVYYLQVASWSSVSQGSMTLSLGREPFPALPGEIAWDFDPVSSDRSTRSLRFTVQPPEGGISGAVAIKVTMVDLQHPTPPNLPSNPPQDFSFYESTTCTAAGEVNGCARWVGRPGTFYEAQGPPQTGPYLAARLQCTPFYWDWISETADGPITVVGAEIMPSSEYSVQAYDTSCAGHESCCAAISTAVTMYTRRFGDVDADYHPPSTTSQPNAIDVAQLVNKFKNAVGSPDHFRAQLQPNLPELNASVNALDIVAVVDAVKGLAYAFTGPCPCPSTVTCGGSCTGCAGMCVKTCIGGDNGGDPCINSTHCPGGGACSAVGTCRDRCGRCTPESGN